VKVATEASTAQQVIVQLAIENPSQELEGTNDIAFACPVRSDNERHLAGELEDEVIDRRQSADL